jgi:hypothetical protein
MGAFVAKGVNGPKSDTTDTSYYFAFAEGITNAEANLKAKTAVSDNRLQCRVMAGRESLYQSRNMRAFW